MAAGWRRPGERDDKGVVTLTRAAYTAVRRHDEQGLPQEADLGDHRGAGHLRSRPASAVSYQRRAAELSRRDRAAVAAALLAPRRTGPGGFGPAGPDVHLQRAQRHRRPRSPITRQFAPNSRPDRHAYLFTGVAPMLEAQYRALGPKGAFQVRAISPTASSPIDAVDGAASVDQYELRGYIEANGTVPALRPIGRISGSLRGVTDKTFLRRYDISLRRPAALGGQGRADRRRQLSVDRRLGDSQTLLHRRNRKASCRSRCRRSTIACAPDHPVLGGTITSQANTLGITRTEGQDTQRAFVRRAVEKCACSRAGPDGHLHRAGARRRLSHVAERPDRHDHLPGRAGLADARGRRSPQST